MLVVLSVATAQRLFQPVGLPGSRGDILAAQVRAGPAPLPSVRAIDPALDSDVGGRVTGAPPFAIAEHPVALTVCVLFVLAKGFSRKPSRSRGARCADDSELKALPEEVAPREVSEQRTIEVDGNPVQLDELGPIVISKEGKLGSLSNCLWLPLPKKLPSDGCLPPGFGVGNGSGDG